MATREPQGRTVTAASVLAMAVAVVAIAGTNADGSASNGTNRSGGDGNGGSGGGVAEGQLPNPSQIKESLDAANASLSPLSSFLLCHCPCSSQSSFPRSFLLPHLGVASSYLPLPAAPPLLCVRVE